MILRSVMQRKNIYNFVQTVRATLTTKHNPSYKNKTLVMSKKPAMI